MPAGTPRPSLQITGSVQVLPHYQLDGAPIQPIVVHRSLPLAQLLKLMNIVECVQKSLKNFIEFL